MTVSVSSAARYLCEKSGWKISNLAIHKILYMADMNFVGQGNGRLVDEDFEAWDYGPVLPSLYHQCKAFGAKPVPDIFWGAADISDRPETKMIDLAWESLKHLTPGQLVANTHSSSGEWVKRYIAGARQRKITTDDMVDEYRERIERQRAAVA